MEAVDAHGGHVILFGSGNEDVKFSYVLDSGDNKGKRVSKKHPFEGIIPNMQRRYHETDSALVREDLGRMRAVQLCPDCGGSRLRAEARHVRLGEGPQARAMFEISHATSVPYTHPTLPTKREV